jgi:hypothetical protein
VPLGDMAARAVALGGAASVMSVGRCGGVCDADGGDEGVLGTCHWWKFRGMVQESKEMMDEWMGGKN